MMLKILLQKKWSILILFLAPMIFVLTSFFMTDQQTDELEVPIVLVDESNQAITEQLLSDMTTEDSFDVMVKDTIPEHLIKRGEVEAIFVLPGDLEEKINSGDLEGEIKWYRHERSLFDGLFKEQLASAIMTRAVRAESANIVKRYDEQANWSEIYEYGLRYLEPEPIFQIQFESIQQQLQTDRSKSDGGLLYRWLYWVFIWVMLASLVKLILTWKELKIFERMETLGHSNTLYYIWFMTFLIALSVLTLFTSFGIQLMYGELDWINLLIDTAIAVTSLFLYFVVALTVRKMESLWVFTLSYGVTASIIFFLIYFKFLSMNYWMTIFLPVWILIY
ncbi:ABC transporter permease [Piscibacillus sp. B03]|uniref:ABC transporter permease n=1 Tax=Piscibacillus sp. B03 TaxID=3457430 RepID=UPI003FCE06DF